MARNPNQSGPKSSAAFPKTRRFARLLERIIENTGSEQYAMLWLRAPHEQLGGQSPLEVIQAGGIAVIEGLNRAYETGQPL